MLNQYEPNVKAVITFLRLTKVKINNETVNETLQNHPDWPSLLCISDSLNKWNIPNGAGKIGTHDIDQLPVPFIAYTSEREFPLTVVTNITNTTIEVCHKSYNKLITVTKEDFFEKWDGVYLMAEPNERSGEPNYKTNKRKALFKSFVPTLVFAVLIIFSVLLLDKIIARIGPSAPFSTSGIYLQYGILLTGVIFTLLLLWYEMDKNNPLLQKVCTGIAKGNCKAILTGKQAKLFTWLSWSEVGFFYFTGGLLVLLSGSNAFANSFGLIAWLNILALPYTVFSFYYQWWVAKQWCVLCLAVQVLLILGAINVLMNGFLFPFPHLTISFIVNTLLMYLLPILLWYALKPYILSLQEAKNTKREYLRIKFNTEIFGTLLKKQGHITMPAEGLGISLGNPTATNTLIKVCNPYCSPCAKAHPKIDKLLEEISNLKVKIIFTTPNQPEKPDYRPVSHLLAINEQKNNEKAIKQALDDWYLADRKYYEHFAIKYPMKGELKKQGNKIEAMHKWCRAMDIRDTPTFIINGYRLPNIYSIEDLQYFLLD